MSVDANEAALRIEPTPYFRRIGGALRRGVRVHLPRPLTCRCRVYLDAEGDRNEAAYSAERGIALAFGPTTYDRLVHVRASVWTPGGTWMAEATLPPTKLWCLYVCQDKHLDYAWIHPVERVVERMNALTDYYLAASESLGLRWNYDVAIWVEEYLRTRPSEQRERLLAAMREGRFEVGALWLTPFAGCLGTEELLRALYYARALRTRYGVAAESAVLQEVPTLPWGLATLLAGAGLRYAVKGAYGLRNPHLSAREPYPLFWWQGPDGGRVLMRWDAASGNESWGGYAEAYRLWRAQDDTERVRFIEDTVARYQGYERYPLSSILLAGSGFDEYPQTTAIGDFIRQFAEQGLEYPKVVDATYSQFWQDVEEELARTGAELPVASGDWGASWEEWPAQLARSNTVYRRNRETVLSAQAAAAWARRRDAGKPRQHRAADRRRVAGTQGPHRSAPRRRGPGAIALVRVIPPARHSASGRRTGAAASRRPGYPSRRRKRPRAVAARLCPTGRCRPASLPGAPRAGAPPARAAPVPSAPRQPANCSSVARGWLAWRHRRAPR